MRPTRKVRTYDLAFREDSVALLHRSKKGLDDVASSLGLPKSTLYKWYRQDMAKKAKKSGSTGKAVAGRSGAESDADKLARLEIENEALRKQVASLEEDKDILKKFAAFSVREKT